MGESRSEATRPEYLDLLHAPGEARACRDAMLPALFDPAVGRWDILDLCEIGGARLCWPARSGAPGRPGRGDSSRSLSRGRLVGDKR